MILNKIIAQKRKDVEELKRRLPLRRLRETLDKKAKTDHRSFRKALSETKKFNLICELKKASPSEGIIRQDFQPLRLAGLYEAAGAAAISVLTEPHFFHGRASYLKTVRQVTTIPLLRKDFIIDSYQLYESALLEADAFLLIACILTDEELRNFIQLGKDLKMDALVEVHAEEDLKKAIDAGVEILGINNRNLQTLEVDTDRAKKLLPRIPQGTTIVVESGFKKHLDLVDYQSLNIHNFLIGTSIMKSPDVFKKIEELLGKRKEETV